MIDDQVYMNELRQHEWTQHCIKISPHFLYKPKLFIDGDSWCCLYGEDLQMGVAGFGPSPEKACEDFDKNWQKHLRPIAGSKGIARNAVAT